MGKGILTTFVFILSLAIILSSTYASERDTIVAELEFSHEGVPQLLPNGEIWVSGSHRQEDETYYYWLAQINEAGEVIDYYSWNQYVLTSPVVSFGNRRYVTSRYKEPNTNEMHYVFIPLLGNGKLGKEVEMAYPYSRVVPLPSGILSMSSFWTDPWISLYDKDLNLVMNIEHPFDLFTDNAKPTYPLGSVTRMELSDGILLFGCISPGVCYLIEVDFDGVLHRSLRIELGFGVYSAVVYNEQILIVAKELAEWGKGSTYLVCMNFDGIIEWKKLITSDGTYQQQKMILRDDGIILYGWREVPGTSPQGGTHLLCCLKKLTFDGDIVAETDCSGLYGVHEGIYYFAGSQSDDNKIIIEKIAEEDLFTSF